MNRKLIAIVLVCLLIGILVGFAIGFTSKIQSFFVEYGALNTRYNELRTDYDNLNATYNQLNTTYNELQANYTLLKSVKYTFDSSIQISDLTIDVGYWSAYVKGNVTNIGTTPIKSLYIFAFQYNPDGSLHETYGSPDYEFLENLYPNETLPFEICFSTVEGQIFKIFAVGNY